MNQKRGEELRRTLSVDNSHPFHSRAMRNYLEHFDKVLDSWITSGKGHHYGRISGGSAAGKFRDTDIALNFERDTELLRFFGEEYDLKLIAGETEKLYERSRKITKELMK
jgi:hypothetical protein